MMINFNSQAIIGQDWIFSGLSIAKIKVMVALSTFLHRKTLKCNPSREKLAERAKMPPDEVSRITRWLEKNGWIKRIKKGNQVIQYYLFDKKQEPESEQNMKKETVKSYSRNCKSIQFETAKNSPESLDAQGLQETNKTPNNSIEQEYIKKYIKKESQKHVIGCRFPPAVPAPTPAPLKPKKQSKKKTKVRQDFGDSEVDDFMKRCVNFFPEIRKPGYPAALKDYWSKFTEEEKERVHQHLVLRSKTQQWQSDGGMWVPGINKFFANGYHNQDINILVKLDKTVYPAKGYTGSRIQQNRMEVADFLDNHRFSQAQSTTKQSFEDAILDAYSSRNSANYQNYQPIQQLGYYGQSTEEEDYGTTA